MRLFYPLVVSCLLSACATNPGLYQWGSYENDLYASYKEPAKTEALRQKLEAQINAQESANARVAPGLYAELGTLYLQKGEPQKAQTFYAKERDAWPESKVLMDAMIQNLDRMKKPAPGEKQGDQS